MSLETSGLFPVCNLPEESFLCQRLTTLTGPAYNGVIEQPASYKGKIMSYNEDPDYPDKSFTIADAEVTDAGGACPFQANGYVNGSSFYFRLRWGSASLEIGSDYRNSLDASTAHYGHLDGSCSYSDFEALFNELAADYRPMKVPVRSPEEARLSIDDFHIDHVYGGEYAHVTGDSKEETGEDIYFTFEIDGGIAKLTIGDYERAMDVDTHEWLYIRDTCGIEDFKVFFNILIADYR